MLIKRRDDGRGDLTDEQWMKLQPVFPPQKAWTGKPALDHIATLLMAFFGYTELVRCGEIYQSVKAQHSTISSRFYRWRTQGLWQRMWENLMQQADAVGDINWEVHFVDSTIVRAR